MEIFGRSRLKIDITINQKSLRLQIAVDYLKKKLSFELITFMIMITLCLFQNGINNNVFLCVITHLYGIFCLLKGGITSFLLFSNMNDTY